MPTPENTPAASPAAFHSSSTAKPPRVLACVLCQQRKVKCDRKFPCANCVKSHAQCVPAATLAPRQRRRRFPERELLDRLHRYENLLHQNNINFEPLHQGLSNIEKQSRNMSGGVASGCDFLNDEQQGATAGPDGSSSPSTAGKSDNIYKAKNFWHAMNQKFRDSDDDSSDSSPDDMVREAMIKKAWNEMYQSNDPLLFGSRKTAVDLSTLHPDQVQIFKLWQIYLDNVNPLLKVTHTPTLQGRIIDAASDVASIKPTLLALMFSIYCMSVLSLAEDECHVMFGSPKDHLLARYQFGCRQALLKCGFLRSGDHECLTALFLYLMTAKSCTDPQSLSSMLSLAIRIAQRMGLHNESAYAKYPALEAEMRRRLWWSLILFDTRICEMVADFKSVNLIPTWDCRTPLNVNDFDLQPGMKDPPAVQGESTETLFAVVRSQMGEFIRHSAFHLDFVNPALKTIAKDVQHGPIPEGGELVTLEKMIEDKYLKFCNPENPLHFMTIWTARGYLAKNHLVETYSKFTKASAQQMDAQRDAAIFYTLRMLECDTKLMTSPLTKGYLWFIKLYFPFPAYIHIVQDLRRRPLGDHAEQVWEAMSDNYEVRIMPHDDANPFFTIFAHMVLQAWEAREAVCSQSEKPLVPPRIVSHIRRNVAQPTQDAQNANRDQPSDVLGMSIDDFSTFMLMDFSSHGMCHSMGGQSYEGAGAEHEQAALGIDMNQLDWNPMDWNSMQDRGW